MFQNKKIEKLKEDIKVLEDKCRWISQFVQCHKTGYLVHSTKAKEIVINNYPRYSSSGYSYRGLNDGDPFVGQTSKRYYSHKYAPNYDEVDVQEDGTGKYYRNIDAKRVEVKV